MSNEMRGEDTILGTALARAIESQPIRSTPFERSRVAVRMAGGGRSPLFPVLAAAAAVVLGLALGAALLGQRGGDPSGVASSPTPSSGATESPGATSEPTGAPASEVPSEPVWVFFARDLLPPVGGNVLAGGARDAADGRIGLRLSALWGARPNEVPLGSVNVFAQSGRSGSGGTLGVSTQIAGDLATVTFDLGDAGWNVSGSAASQALLQQLVYTITEELGIRRALIREKGKNEAVIDQLVIDKPLTREDVLPYEGVKTEQRVALEDDPRPSTLTTRVDASAGLTRFVIEMKANEAPAEGFWSPRLFAELGVNNGGGEDPAVELIGGLPGKWVLKLQLPGGTDANAWDAANPRGAPPKRAFEGTALRSVTTMVGTAEGTNGTTYLLGLDDARPWRISLEPASPGTMWLTVDIGGHPQAISDSVAVYVPRPGDEITLGNAPSNPRTFVVKGTARAFEAHVAWRLKDSNQREVATGFATASLGTSPVWGTFSTEVKVPDGVSGVVTLEVFWPSPRDGADVGKVAIPLRVR